ncbi:hypothetical protein NM688_g2993 [Phlebia brevispora]|uniref:Uncharacterized protein n=1 Tax=Phlebia brevispora TaxID=194682 RepID=A0ACC1T781_9APHY|nr:hypothetical protein NM688_g2993 [Phlebia brevispora]
MLIRFVTMFTHPLQFNHLLTSIVALEILISHMSTDTDIPDISGTSASAHPSEYMPNGVDKAVATDPTRSPTNATAGADTDTPIEVIIESPLVGVPTFERLSEEASDSVDARVIADIEPSSTDAVVAAEESFHTTEAVIEDFTLSEELSDVDAAGIASVASLTGAIANGDVDTVVTITQTVRTFSTHGESPTVIEETTSQSFEPKDGDDDFVRDLTIMVQGMDTERKTES